MKPIDIVTYQSSKKRTRRVHRDFQEFLLNQLQDPEEAALYLKAALADDDERVFLLALRDVLEVRGNTISDLLSARRLSKR
jgi:DNA-binding phage protein